MVDDSRLHRISFRVNEYLYGWLMREKNKNKSTISEVLRDEVLRPAIKIAHDGNYDSIARLLNSLNYKDFAKIYHGGKGRPTVRLSAEEIRFVSELAQHLDITKGLTLRILIGLRIKKLI